MKGFCEDLLSYTLYLFHHFSVASCSWAYLSQKPLWGRTFFSFFSFVLNFELVMYFPFTWRCCQLSKNGYDIYINVQALILFYYFAICWKSYFSSFYVKLIAVNITLKKGNNVLCKGFLSLCNLIHMFININIKSNIPFPKTCQTNAFQPFFPSTAPFLCTRTAVHFSYVDSECLALHLLKTGWTCCSACWFVALVLSTNYLVGILIFVVNYIIKMEIEILSTRLPLLAFMYCGIFLWCN